MAGSTNYSDRSNIASSSDCCSATSRRQLSVKLYDGLNGRKWFAAILGPFLSFVAVHQFECEATRQSVEVGSTLDLLEGTEQSAERRAFSRQGLQ
jgi:hypothetical protein